MMRTALPRTSPGRRAPGRPAPGSRALGSRALGSRALGSPAIQLVAGGLVALVAVGLLSAIMLPLRHHLAVATCALVLVVPVGLAASVGGFGSGAIGVALGFLAYDYLFIPPYGTLSVGAAQNWVALGVYVVVMLVVTRVVDRLHVARAEAARHEASTRRLFELSDVLIADKPLGELLGLVVATVQAAFGLAGVCVLVPTEHGLEVGAAAGAAFSDEELGAVRPHAGSPATLEMVTAGSGSVVAVPLTAAGGPVGALLAKGNRLLPAERGLLRTYANQAALAFERARLREQARRNEILEEADRWKDALVGAVSHDLRTPLATVKAAVSELRRSDAQLSGTDADELLCLVEAQSDRLARLVTNLLDLTRISAGALELHTEVVPLEEIAVDAVETLAGTDVPSRTSLDLPEGLPPVEVDPLLVRQVLVNLLENASLHAPSTGAVEVEARLVGEKVEVRVSDDGPGISEADRDRIFLLFKQTGAAGRAGIGLAIVKAFVEAHGERVWIEERAGGGACFGFSLPAHLRPAGRPGEEG